jgi:hypothetical protein
VRELAAKWHIDETAAAIALRDFELEVAEARRQREREDNVPK